MKKGKLNCQRININPSCFSIGQVFVKSFRKVQGVSFFLSSGFIDMHVVWVTVDCDERIRNGNISMAH